MRLVRLRLTPLVLALAITGSASRARADDDATPRARREFVAATNFVTEARWGEALAAFERSAALRPHALTTYNMGACERALGRYVRARKTLRAALEENSSRGGSELPSSFAMQANEYLQEIEGIIAHVDITVAPADAELLVDGQPAPKDSAAASLSLDLDPGVHVFRLSREGFGRAFASRALGAGTRTALHLDLQRLPATLSVSANESSSVVTVAGLDVGVAPVEVSRPSGTYAVLVRKPGYVPYSTTVDLSPGTETKLRASLVPETKPLYTRLWFWGVAVAVVGGAAA
jgi:hypothetical protein